jgi:hypothetical protein
MVMAVGIALAGVIIALARNEKLPERLSGKKRPAKPKPKRT